MTRSDSLPALWLAGCVIVALGVVLLAPSGPPKVGDRVAVASASAPSASERPVIVVAARR